MIAAIDSNFCFFIFQSLPSYKQALKLTYFFFQPHVRIWESVSLNTLHVIGLGVFNRAVCCVSFSKLVS